MKRGPLFTSLVFLASFLLPLSSAYSGYDIITEADFLTRGQKYEAADIGDLLLDKQNLMGMVPGHLTFSPFFQNNFFGPFPESCMSILPTHQNNSLLRC